MKLNYKIMIERPEQHIAKVKISGEGRAEDNKLSFFIPSWSPGSYLMREYGKNIRSFKVLSEMGQPLHFTQTRKGVYEVDWLLSEKEITGLVNRKFEVEYDVYCHELTVRTSHIDNGHAFLHLPSVLMGILGQKLSCPTLELHFPNSWSKVSTGLKDISKKREVFIYEAIDYDTLIDAPIEIGCHETDGFSVGDKEHELAFYGQTFDHGEDLKKDIKTIVETVLKTMKDIPYDKYLFLTHFLPGKFGGLEHLNSTALQFCSTRISDREGYITWLELVAHEYFHTWNVKRIRPKELGPFDYINEGYTRMHWLTEGLTSFMDQLFVLRSGLMTMEEYANAQMKNFNRYLSTPGRKFHSLEESSFNAWIKLYRPDENSTNSSISYYLKGGIVFFILNILISRKGKSINHLLDLLWARYKNDPDNGLENFEVYQMIEDLGGVEVRDEFEKMISTTEELDFEKYCKELGWEFEYAGGDLPWIGVKAEFKEERVFIKSVDLDGPAYQSGLNAGDEIIAVNGMRFLKNRYNDMAKFLKIDHSYTFTIARLELLQELSVNIGRTPKTIKAIKIANEEMTRKVLL